MGLDSCVDKGNSAFYSTDNLTVCRVYRVTNLLSFLAVVNQKQEKGKPRFRSFSAFRTVEGCTLRHCEEVHFWYSIMITDDIRNCIHEKGMKRWV